MCLAFPGKIVEVAKGKAVVDYGSEKRQAGIAGVVPKKGDWVLMSGRLVTEIVPEKQAKKMLEAWAKV